MSVPSNCATLPSSTAAAELIAGDLAALPRVVLSTIGRAALVGVGLAVAGVRGRRLAVEAMAGAAGVEVFVLGFAAWKRHTGCAAGDAK